MESVANKLFSHFECGQWDEAAKLFSPDAKIVQQYGMGRALTFEQFKKSTANGPLSAAGLPVYSDRRVSVTKNGFIEQHTTTLHVNGQKLSLKALLVARCDKGGLIQELEEYLDPTAFVRALTRSPKLATGDASLPARKKSATIKPGLVVVITGASRGIGEQIAYRYASTGAKVVLAARKANDLRRVMAKCKSLNRKCEVEMVVADVADRDQCQSIVDAAVGRFGHINRLILNAGISQSCYLKDASSTLIQRIMDVNFFGCVNTAQAALPHLANPQEGGSRIMIISSALGRLVAPTQTGYAASKWALHGFFGSLRCELKATGTTVSMVCPGPVNTSILGNLEGPGGSTVGFELDEETLKKMMTAATAAKLAFNACESGKREVIFGQLGKLVKLRSSQPDRVDEILSKMYNGMHQEIVPRSRI